MPWREDLTDEDKRRRVLVIQRSLVATVCIFLFICLFLLMFATYTGAQDRARLIECTTPGGECYDKGQENTAKLVQQLIQDNLNQELATRQVVLAAAACADKPRMQTVAAIRQCVDDVLGQEN